VALVIAKVIQGDDAGMFEKRDERGLTLKAQAPRQIAGPLARQHLDGHQSTEAVILGQPGDCQLAVVKPTYEPITTG
jgi:hypothetical protein